MAQYATLKAAIDAVIKANGQKEITGTVLNEVLTSMVNSLGANYQFAGVATPSTNPGTPDQNVFYLAFEAGTYTNFNATVLSAGISILMWNGSWSSQTFYTIDATPTPSSNNLISSGAVFDAIKTDGSAYDVSAHFPTGGPDSDGKFTLEYILSNANTLIPAAWRKGGMSIRFVSSSDNNYVQYRCKLPAFSTNPIDWAEDLEEIYNQIPDMIYKLSDKRGLNINSFDDKGRDYTQYRYWKNIRGILLKLTDSVNKTVLSISETGIFSLFGAKLKKLYISKILTETGKNTLTLSDNNNKGISILFKGEEVAAFNKDGTFEIKNLILTCDGKKYEITIDSTKNIKIYDYE